MGQQGSAQEDGAMTVRAKGSWVVTTRGTPRNGEARLSCCGEAFATLEARGSGRELGANSPAGRQGRLGVSHHAGCVDVFGGISRSRMCVPRASRILRV